MSVVKGSSKMSEMCCKSSLTHIKSRGPPCRRKTVRKKKRCSDVLASATLMKNLSDSGRSFFVDICFVVKFLSNFSTSFVTREPLETLEIVRHLYLLYHADDTGNDVWP
jgi:hypothetical protein